jgi:hypothetical protein
VPSTPKLARVRRDWFFLAIEASIHLRLRLPRNELHEPTAASCPTTPKRERYGNGRRRDENGIRGQESPHSPLPSNRRDFPHVVSKAAPIDAREKEELSHVGLRVTKPVQRLVKMQEKINEIASGFIQDFGCVVADTFGQGTGW